jgi:ABC-type ATPase involved in cell division
MPESPSCPWKRCLTWRPRCAERGAAPDDKKRLPSWRSWGLNAGRRTTLPKCPEVNSSAIAIARALVSRPRLLLADEPTGELDSTTGRNLLTLLRSIVRTEGVTLIMATHDRTIFDFVDVVYQLRDGQIVVEG